MNQILHLESTGTWGNVDYVCDVIMKVAPVPVSNPGPCVAVLCKLSMCADEPSSELWGSEAREHDLGL